MIFRQVIQKKVRWKSSGVSTREVTPKHPFTLALLTQ